MIERLKQEMERRSMMNFPKPAASPSVDKVAPPETSPPPDHCEPTDSLYATAQDAVVCLDTGKQLATKGDRIVVVFPQILETNGNVSMYMKSVDPDTALITYKKILVFVADDGEGNDIRRVANFSLFP